MTLDYARERARDSLAFDPLPESRWVTVTEKGISISVRYNERLSKLLHRLPAARWDPAHRVWRYPFSSADAIRRAMPQIEELAAAAQETADKENQKRRDEKKRRKLAWDEENRDQERRRALAQQRPFRHEFLNAVAGRPRYALTLEAIGDHLRAMGFTPRNWVARLFGSDGKGGWARAFVSGAKDYAEANSVGSRGIKVTYFLEEGPIYEVQAPQSWKSTDRYFLRIVEGATVRMSKAEVEACLEN